MAERRSSNELAMRELADAVGAEWQTARVQPARRMSESVSGLSVGSSYLPPIFYELADKEQRIVVLGGR